MRILMIGGTRFVGRSLSQMLHMRGDTIVIANRGRTPDDLPFDIARLRVDIGEPNALADAVSEQTYDAAINMIAYGADSTHNVLQALQGKIGQYVQCGSTGVYAPLKYCPADEQHPTCPRPEFGGFNDKLASDQVALQWCAEQTLPCAIVRPSNIIGAGDVAIDVWGARNPAFFQRIIDGQIISVPNDGRALLQPVHKDDVAQALLRALDNPCSGTIYNASTAYAVTLDYYVEAAAHLLGTTATIEHVPMEQLIAQYAPSGKLDDGGIRFLCEHMCISIEKARRELGYEPQFTPEAGLAQTLEWMFAEGLIHR